MPSSVPQSEAVPPATDLLTSGLSRLLLRGVFSVLLLAPLFFGSTDPWATALLQCEAAVLLVLWSVRQHLQGGSVVQGNPLFAPMLGVAVLVGVQIVFRHTAYPKQTMTDALLYLSYATLSFLVVQVVRRGSHVRKLAVVFTAYGTAVAIFALLQSFTSNGKIYWTWAPQFGGWIYGPYVNHNHYAGLMELLVPVPLVAAFTGFLKGRDRAIAAGAAAIMAGTVFLSGSRGGMLALTLEIGLLATILLRQRRAGPSGFVLSVFLIAFLGFIAWTGGGEITSRLSTIGEETRKELSGGMRLSIDRDGLHMFTQHPVLGWGLGTFPIVYPQFRSFSTTFFVNEAHNDYVQWLVEMGAAGLALMIWFLVRFYRSVWRKLPGWENSANGALALAALLGCSGVLVHAFLDFNLQIPANAALFYALAALGAATPVPESVRRRKSHSLLVEEVWATSA